eukprot:CAMPEP_0196129564 /NCGR_PEP_ID=MMETSP0910-20130528/210_1 /TAXON_ID=49265 /ORGANISM="Thalassiosira rotula, Strain GSO102" /LENGTH=119 /DNA_ID=CAMNT_0041388689 /DNA_START=69 /DNA_END=428 /DNA_ORIENTATION=-
MRIPSPSIFPLLLGLILIVTSQGDDGSCSGMTPCDTAGATCTQGTESCCGETYPSLHCNCADDDGSGDLVWNCIATDYCFLPCDMRDPAPAPAEVPGDGATDSLPDSLSTIDEETEDQT